MARQHFTDMGQCVQVQNTLKIKRGTKDTRGTVKLINRNKLTTPWLKMKHANRQTIVHVTQHRKLKNKQHEPHQNLGVISDAPEG